MHIALQGPWFLPRLNLVRNQVDNSSILTPDVGPTAGGGEQPTWDSNLYTSGDRAAVLCIAAYQAPASAQQSAPSCAGGNAHAAGSGGGGGAGGGGGRCNGAQSETRHHVLFSDARGFACHMAVAVAASPAAAASLPAAQAACSRWQPHEGRCRL